MNGPLSSSKEDGDAASQPIGGRFGSICPGPALLFCPGSLPRRLEKAAAVADGVIIDLEDAVSAEAKDAARREAIGALNSGLDPTRTIVRINSLSSQWGRDDIRALDDTPLRIVMLPKCEGPAPHAIAARFSVIALCETARGITMVQAVADSPGCVGVAWGSQDLAADLATSPLDRRTRQVHPTGQFARQQVRFAAAAAQIPAIDTVWTDISDSEGLLREAREAAELGFAGKLVIHPRQVEIVRSAFQPSDEELAWARRILGASAPEDGATIVSGEMVDAPVRARATELLRRARWSGADTT